MTTQTTGPQQRDTVTELLDDLSSYRLKLREADLEVSRLRREHADVDLLSTATARRDALNQTVAALQTDLSSAQGAQAVQDARELRATQVAELVDLATQTTALQKELGTIVDEGSEQLKTILEALRRTVLELRATRRTFAEKADALAPETSYVSGSIFTSQGSRLESEALLSELQKSVNLGAVLGLSTGRFTKLDVTGKPLPARDMYGVALWSALAKTTEMGTHHLYEGLQTPTKSV